MTGEGKPEIDIRKERNDSFESGVKYAELEQKVFELDKKISEAEGASDKCFLLKKHGDILIQMSSYAKDYSYAVQGITTQLSYLKNHLTELCETIEKESKNK